MIYVHQMPDGSETIQLLSVPVRIREFVASVREIKDLSDVSGQILLSDQDGPENASDLKYEAERRRKGKQILSENSAAERKRKQSVVSDEGSAKRAAYFDLNEYPSDNEATTVHDKYAPKDTEAPETSGVKKQPNGKEVAVYQNSEDSDSDSSRTISDLPTETMSLNHGRYEEVVNKATKIKSILKKSCPISRRYEVVNEDDITRISLPKRKTVGFNLGDDDDNNINSNNNKRKRKKNKHAALPMNESPKSNKDEPSKRKPCSGPSGSKVAVGRVRKSKPLKKGPKRLKPLGNDMAKEVKCRGLSKCNAVGGCEPSGSNSVVHQAGKVNISGEIVQARELSSETLVCTISQNPAEFIPEIAKKFLR